MANESEITTQSNRITFMVMDFMGSHYRGVEFSVGPDAARNRVTVTVNKSVPVEFGPENWSLNDNALRDVVTAEIRTVFRANLP